MPARTTLRDTIVTFDSALAELNDRLTRTLERAARAEATVERIARGSLNVTTEAAQVVAEFDAEPTKPGRKVKRSMPAPAAPTPEDRSAQLERSLRAAPGSITEIAGRLKIPSNHVAIALRTLKRGGQVHNIGSAEQPRWTWVVGEDATPAELTSALESLLRDRPMTLRELVSATGAPYKRVSTTIVAIQRRGAKVENRGTATRARWFLPR